MGQTPFPSPAPAPRLALRERRVDFAMLYREMHYCYGRMLGLEGIALWSWYRLHQHGGGAYKELAGYGWTGQASTMGAHDIKHKATLRRIRDALVTADLIVIREAREVFTQAELEELRERARANGEMLSIQPASHLIFAQDPLSREDFVVWNGGQECRSCPVNISCQAYRHWRQSQQESGLEFAPPGRTVAALPDGPENSPRRGAGNSPPARAENAPQAGSITAHKPNKQNQEVVSTIEPFVIYTRDVELERLKSQLEELGFRQRSVNLLLKTPTETAYQLKHLAELKVLGKTPTSITAWMAAAVKGSFRFTGQPRADEVAIIQTEFQLSPAPLVEAELSQEEQLWKATLARLQTAMTRATFERWFPETSLSSITEQEALITVTTPAAQEWLSKRLSQVIERELSAVVGRPVRLRVEVADKIVPFKAPDDPIGPRKIESA